MPITGIFPRMMLPTHALTGLAIAARWSRWRRSSRPSRSPVRSPGASSPTSTCTSVTGGRCTTRSGTASPRSLPVSLAFVLATPALVAAAFLFRRRRAPLPDGPLRRRPRTAPLGERVGPRRLRPRQGPVASTETVGSLRRRAGGRPFRRGSGAPLLVALDGPFRWATAVALAIGVTYGLLRRRLAALAPIVAGHVPASVEHHVPDRYRE